MKSLITFAIPALLLCASLGACNKPETPAETREDVAKAVAEGEKNVAKAENKMIEEHHENAAEAMAKNQAMSKGDRKEDVDNMRKVDKAQVEADYKIAKEQCDALSGDAKDSCLKAAKADYESAMIIVNAKSDLAKVKIKEQPGK